jgi:signal transduction histidine kinase
VRRGAGAIGRRLLEICLAACGAAMGLMRRPLFWLRWQMFLLLSSLGRMCCRLLMIAVILAAVWAASEFASSHKDLISARRAAPLAASLESDQFFSSRRARRDIPDRSGMLAGAGILAALVLIALAVKRVRFSKHKREVARIADTIRKFVDGDLRQRVPVSPGEEMHQLGSAVNQLADTVWLLSERDSARKELIADISHDLLKPVGSIRAYLDTILMAKGGLKSEELESYLKTILKNTASLDRLVSEFLYLSKLDSVHSQVNIEPFSVLDLANDIYLKFMPLASARFVKLQVRSDSKVTLAYGDVGLMERALSNLVDNAIRYTLPGGSVSLSFFLCDGRVMIEVKDSGIGIAREELPRVFEPLYRAPKIGLQDSGGTGLGLAIVRKVIAAHASQLYVESEPCRGTTMAFALKPA